MFFSRLATLLNRSVVSTLTKPAHSHNVMKALMPFPVCSGNTAVLSAVGPSHQPQMSQIRTFRDKDILKLRCNACYFKKVDDRWWVLCNKHPRHKQRTRVENEKMNWIVTHITRTGSYKKKHFAYPNQDI